MNSKERVLCALNLKESDRIAIHDAPWGTTIRRWQQEGMPQGVGPDAFFGYEFHGVGADTSFQFPTETLEDADTYTIVRNANGAVMKNWKNQTSTPEYTEFAITSRRIWEEHKPRLAMNPSRVDVEGCRRAMESARQTGKFFYFSGAIGYDKTQGFVGSERLLMAMAEDPEWAADMFLTSARMVVECAEELIGAGIEFDGAFMYDDMGYRNASLFSPAMFRELNKPAHKMVYQFFRSKGLKTILHSCGCVKSLIPDLIDAGLACLQPLEVKAGMDLVELKKQYGDRLAFMGGIDVRKMAHPDPRLIEEEIRTKITCAKQGGGYIYHSDHSVPDSVSFQQYCQVMELVRYYGRYE